MRSTPSKDSPSTSAIWLQVIGSTIFACLLASWFLELSGRKISPMWPAAGVTTAFFYVYGKRAWLPSTIAHLIAWAALEWPVLWISLLYPLEGWLVVFLGRLPLRRPDKEPREGLSVAWQKVGAPILGCLPLPFLLTWLLSDTGRFQPGVQGTTAFLLMMSHVHGIIAFGPITLHLLRRDFSLLELRWSRIGILAGVGGLLIMGLAFLGAFAPALSQGSAIYLPFPFLMMAAITLRPPAISILITIWCLVSTGLNCLGSGPFVVDVELAGRTMNAAEMSIYNMLMASVAYLISVESTRIRRKLNLNKVAMSAVGIELWEWELGRGLIWVENKQPNTFSKMFPAGPDADDQLPRLMGLDMNDLQNENTWRHRVQTHRKSFPKGTPSDFESVGRILDRDKKGRPKHAMGLLQDLSAIRKSEDALKALDAQKARLKNLQANLHPHFLFNSLNVIRALVHVDPGRADQAITSLAKLLRSTLKATKNRLISLELELDQIEALLQLARLRFGERLATNIEIPKALFDTPVPPMLLLNLVENALTHGIGNLTEGGFIRISAERRDQHVHLSVRNSGKLSNTVIAGVGTRDVKNRLELLYSGKALFSLVQIDKTTVAAEIMIPLNQTPTHVETTV